MTQEEKINYLEDKLARTIELIKLMVHLDDGLNAKDANWLLEQIDELQEWEDTR